MVIALRVQERRHCHHALRSPAKRSDITETPTRRKRVNERSPQRLLLSSASACHLERPRKFESEDRAEGIKIRTYPARATHTKNSPHAAAKSSAAPCTRAAPHTILGIAKASRNKCNAQPQCREIMLPSSWRSALPGAQPKRRRRGNVSGGLLRVSHHRKDSAAPTQKSRGRTCDKSMCP